jgi:hypothetical protein
MGAAPATRPFDYNDQRELKLRRDIDSMQRYFERLNKSVQPPTTRRAPQQDPMMPNVIPPRYRMPDTFLLPPAPARPVPSTRPFSLPAIPFSLPVIPGVPSQPLKPFASPWRAAPTPGGIPPDWHEFEFNGENVYVIPLKSGG